MIILERRPNGDMVVCDADFAEKVLDSGPYEGMKLLDAIKLDHKDNLLGWKKHHHILRKLGHKVGALEP